MSNVARTVEEILQHASELATRFEEYEPDPADEVSVAEHMLGRAAIARARAEQQVGEAVTTARAAGMSWKQVGAALGTSAQAAQARYAEVSR